MLPRSLSQPDRPDARAQPDLQWPLSAYTTRAEGRFPGPPPVAFPAFPLSWASLPGTSEPGRTACPVDGRRRRRPARGRRAAGRAWRQRLRGARFGRVRRLVFEFEPPAAGLRPESGRQAPHRRLLVLAKDQAAVAEDPGAGDDYGQCQRLARQVQDVRPDVLVEEEHAEQARGQRVEDGEPWL